jgi:NAD(P)-dependent dehydrogenase (short-subunit alcohol dehydrogenase family)
VARRELNLEAAINRLDRFDLMILDDLAYVTKDQAETSERPARLVYLSSGLHRGGEGSPDDLDWKKRPWDSAKAYAESKLHVIALAFALARRWPPVLSNAVDPG